MNAVRVVSEGGIARLTLERPPVNVLTRQVLAELRTELARLAHDAALRTLVMTAAGKHFSAGADVGEHLPPTYAELIPEFMDTVRAIDSFPVPVIAAVQGKCLGGGMELVLAADIVIAADDAAFGQPEIQLGVFPPAACALLPRRVSFGAAGLLLYSGDAIDAKRALAIGLVDRLVPRAELIPETDALASKLARHSAAALRALKRAYWSETARQFGVEAERVYLEELMCSHDATEGLRAFVEKRSPVWSHA